MHEIRDIANDLMLKVLDDYEGGNTEPVTYELSYSARITMVRKLLIWVDEDDRKTITENMENKVAEAEKLCNKLGIEYEKKEQDTEKYYHRTEKNEEHSVSLIVNTTHEQREGIIHEFCDRSKEMIYKQFAYVNKGVNRLKGKEGPEEIASKAAEKAVELVRKRMKTKQRWEEQLKPWELRRNVLTLSLSAGRDQITMNVKIGLYRDRDDHQYVYDYVNYTGYEDLPKELFDEMSQLAMERTAERLAEENDILDTAIVWRYTDSDRDSGNYQIKIFMVINKPEKETKKAWI